jgi:Lon protease-like protein
MKIINLPVFPLSIFLLPQGVTRLRIFEARYLKMVSLAMKNNGFVLLPNVKAYKPNAVATGSWVEIINFDQGDDGLLLIDVRCKCLVDISVMKQDKEQLHHADVSRREHWPELSVDENSEKMATSLKQVFSDNSELELLYVDKYFQQANWVIARWLELIPVELDEKLAFTEQDSFQHAMQFIQSIILAEESSQN